MSTNYAKGAKSLVEVGSSGALVSFQPQTDSLTYEPFFGLTEKPFSLNAEPRFVYDSPTYGLTKEGLLAGIRRREGLLVLTGEIGTGKTTLCRAVLRDLGRKTYSSMVPDPFASREDLLRTLLIDFGVFSAQEITAGRLWQASRTELIYLLSEFLDALAPDTFVVVIIDEAQNLSLPLIEETRILSDTFGAEGLLQIVFVGQPELHAKLKLPEMRQVDQRICGYHRLAPLSREAVAGYIQHRLQAAGGRRDRVLFAPEIVDRLHARTGGVPRLVNRVCDRALHLAFDRRIDGVDQEILETALLEVGATTLSPTWDSIVFAQQPAPPVQTVAPVAAPVAPAVAAAAAPVAPAAKALHPAETEAIARAEGSEDFQNEIDQWVQQDLAPPTRKLTRLPLTVPDLAPEGRSVPTPSRRREAAARISTNDWPRDVRSETYMQRLLRVWTRRAAMAAAVFSFVLVATMVIGTQSQTESFFEGATIPEDAPTRPAPLGVLPAPLATESPVTEVPVAAPTPVEAAPSAAAPIESTPVAATNAVAASGDYLVAVGLFASRERADQLVDSLTQAGLPAMQRPFQLRRQEVQQIVLGPFFSRAEAVADLRRLQGLGGYNDARVIEP